MKWCFFGRESGVEGGGISGGPGGPTPCHGVARHGPRHHVVCWHGGSPWVVPGASLPQFKCKNLIKVFWNLSRKFIFEDFQKLINHLKHGKTIMERWKTNSNQIYRSSKTPKYATNQQKHW
jgi:hypothetical protein